MKPLSQKLAELSVQAKQTEDTVAKAKSQAREHIEQKRDEVRSETEQALQDVKRQFEQVKGEARSRFEALHSKISNDLEQVKQQAHETKGKFEAWQADNYASDKEADALAAIDYAISAIKIAEFQTLDAIAARAEANARPAQSQPTPTMA